MKQDTIDTVAPIEVAQRRARRRLISETVFDIRGLSVYYGGTLAVATSTSRSTATWSPR